MKRKEFLINSALTAFSLSVFGTALPKKESSEFQGDCETTQDILGPFYRPDSPLRSDLTEENMEGNRILVKGIVFKSDCKTPLNNAKVKIWQCDTHGEYDNESDAYRLRGFALTNAKGEYEFKTIIPGKYLNGNLYRPSHIHFRVTEKNSKELISQIYFRGDPHIPQDPWASQGKAIERILEIVPEEINGTLAIRFDIYMRKKIS